MANTYTNIVLHIVFAVKNRESKLPESNLPRFYNYLAGIISKRGHKVIEIGGTSDHVHILINYNIRELIPDLMRDVKSSSTKFINENRLSPFLFSWQRGYGCFSADCGTNDRLREYIRNQKEHHTRYSLRAEMTRILQRYGVEFREEYIFDDV